MTISNNSISVEGTNNDFYFDVAKAENGYSIKSAKDIYIGATKYDNHLSTSATDTYVSNISIDSDGNAVIGATFDNGTVTLRYNKSSGQERFRFYKSGQEAISLFKLDDGQGGGGETPVAVTSVTVTPATASVEVNKTVQLSASVLPANATDPTVTWSSDKENIAVVSANGLVTAKAEGSAVISATAANGTTMVKFPCRDAKFCVSTNVP